MQPPKLFLRFALFSGLALAAAVGLALLLASRNANDRARNRALGDATAVARQFASDDLSRSAFRWPRPAGAGSDLPLFLAGFFTPTTAAHDPAQVILYSRNGIVTYAADHRLIGTRAADFDARARGARASAVQRRQEHPVRVRPGEVRLWGADSTRRDSARAELRADRRRDPRRLHHAGDHDRAGARRPLSRDAADHAPRRAQPPAELRRARRARCDRRPLERCDHRSLVRGRDHVVERRSGDDVRLELRRRPRQVDRVPPACSRRVRRRVGARPRSHDAPTEGRHAGRGVGDDVADSRLGRRARRLVDHRPRRDGARAARSRVARGLPAGGGRPLCRRDCTRLRRGARRDRHGRCESSSRSVVEARPRQDPCSDCARLFARRAAACGRRRAGCATGATRPQRGDHSTQHRSSSSSRETASP